MNTTPIFKCHFILYITYCCSQFLDDFAPVSTKMAKTQSLSLNPTKISGSCGRLMCCLRYEQEAYEDLVKNVPKQGAFVETKDGYGTAMQVNLLRQTVKVKLDGDNDDELHLYKPNELAAVPGGRPKDGAEPPKVLNYVPVEEPEEPETDIWADINYEPFRDAAEAEPVEEPAKVHIHSSKSKWMPWLRVKMTSELLRRECKDAMAAVFLAGIKTG